MSDYIQKLIEEGEHQMLDFKFEISDSKKIARTLAAFANTDGGRLLIGVKDNGAIAGIRSDEEKHMIQTAAELYCQPQVDFQAKEWEINGKDVLEVIVPKSEHHKHKAPDHNGNYKVYVRVKDQNLLATNILLKIWKYQNNKHDVKVSFTETEMLLLRYLNDNKYITLDKYMELAHIKKSLAERILVSFILIGVIGMEMTDKDTFFYSEEGNRKSEEKTR